VITFLCTQNVVSKEDHLCLHWSIFLRSVIAIGQYARNMYIVPRSKLVYVRFALCEHSEGLRHFARYHISERLLQFELLVVHENPLIF
jgi:hypothetical protein